MHIFSFVLCLLLTVSIAEDFKDDKCANPEVVPQMLRPSFVLFGDSITQRSFDEGGWGARLASLYQRKVRPRSRRSCPPCPRTSTCWLKALAIPRNKICETYEMVRETFMTSLCPLWLPPGRCRQQGLQWLQHTMGALPTAQSLPADAASSPKAGDCLLWRQRRSFAGSLQATLCPCGACQLSQPQYLRARLILLGQHISQDQWVRL